MTTIARYNAYIAILALPDLPCLPARGRTWKFAGDAGRRESLKRDLARAYVEHWKADFKDEGAIVSVRRSKLHLVRKSA